MRLVLSLTAILISISVFIFVSTLKVNLTLGKTQMGEGITAVNESSDRNESNAGIEETEKPIVENDGNDPVPAESNAVETGKEKKAAVVVDAGHGGYDVGSIGQNGSREANNTLSVALKLGRILEKKGIRVIYTRKSDTVSWPSSVKSDLLARAEISNNADADPFVSVHNNSSDYKSIRGTETYYCSGSTKGSQLASLIQKQIVKTVGTKDRGIRTEDFSVLKNVKAPSVLVELGYISNVNEEYILGQSEYQQKFAQAIAEAIIKYLEDN